MQPKLGRVVHLRHECSRGEDRLPEHCLLNMDTKLPIGGLEALCVQRIKNDVESCSTGVGMTIISYH